MQTFHVASGETAGILRPADLLLQCTRVYKQTDTAGTP